MYDFLSDIQPDLKSIHEFGSELPVECSEIIMYALGKPFWPYDHHRESYQSRIEKVDATYNFEWHKNVVRILQSSTDQRWLFKCPTHIHFLQELFLTYPDARVIHMHRNPAKAIPSLLSLIRSSHPNIGDQEIEQTLSFCEGGLRKSIDQRSRSLVPPHQIADVHFDSLMSNPIAVIGELYKFLDIDATDNFKKNIKDYLSRYARHKYGSHHYTPEDFNLTERGVLQRFEFYTSHYNIPLRPSN